MTHTPEWPEFDEACDPHLYPLVVLVERDQYNHARLCVNACARLKDSANVYVAMLRGEIATPRELEHLREQNAALSEQVAGLVADAMRYRWWRDNRYVTLITTLFGNGCVNKSLVDVDAFVDEAIAKAGSHE